MTQSRFVGVDGCPEGWFSVGLDGRGRYEVGVFKTFKELLDRYAGAELVLVDIPIGLPEGAGGRDCDREARRRLEARRSSVFPTPTRRTVEQAARSPWDYRRALEVERQFAGKGISQQAFRIAPKIAQVDRALLERGPNATPQVREVHPELCLWALNHKRPMKYGKKKAEGETERLEVLQGIEPHPGDIRRGLFSVPQERSRQRRHRGRAGVGGDRPLRPRTAPNGPREPAERLPRVADGNSVLGPWGREQRSLA